MRLTFDVKQHFSNNHVLITPKKLKTEKKETYIKKQKEIKSNPH